MVIFISTVIVLYFSHLAYWLFALSFAVLGLPLMIPTRCVQMYPVFGCATFVDVAFSITIHHHNMCQLWSIIICWC